jgi:UDP-N-acetylmuramoyl-tripeptide--D-alanyl-D-alanine ligase
MNLNTVASILSQPVRFDAYITNVCTDSRIVEPGNLFIAIRGDSFDGHNFIKEAEAKGAVAAIVNQAQAGISIPQLVVNDSLMALAKIAAAHRHNIHCPVIALTGSNGKTTVKEMIAAILPRPSHATRGNLNNHIGAPLSVLALNKQHQYAVFELGANHPGEIAHTVAVVHPDVTLINNIAPAHVEGFGSIDGVARSKGEIHQGLSLGGTAIVNDDDAYAHFWDDLIADKKVVRFSAVHPTDIYAEDITFNEQGLASFCLVLPNGRTEVNLKVPGMHNVTNALAAAACCYAVGISTLTIEEGLSRFSGVKGRMTLLEGKNQSIIIDDTYNANLRSVLAGLEVLAQYAGEKVLVFGDMGELGQWAEQHHQEVGIAARRLGIDRVLTCGRFSKLTSSSFGNGGEHFSSQEDLADFLIKKINKGTAVLVKGSRSSAMEKIVQKLLS